MCIMAKDPEHELHVSHMTLLEHGRLCAHLVRLMLGIWKRLPAQRFQECLISAAADIDHLHAVLSWGLM